MAKQCQELKVTATIDGVCFYQMEGEYYARLKSSLTRKRVLKDPAFRCTREYAALLGEASKIASGVYRQVAGEQKKHALYRELTGKAMHLLREGKDKEEVFQILGGYYVKKEIEKKITENPQKKNARGSKKAGFGHIRHPVMSVRIISQKPVRRRRYFRNGFTMKMRNNSGP